MANYFIIGGDGKEYGPVTEADVRQWISEDRLNGQSLAKAESDAEFRALAQFPEFAGTLAGKHPPAGAPLAETDGFQEHDYELDIAGCVSRGWDLVKNNMSVLLVGTLIYLLIQMAIGGLQQIPFAGLFVAAANLVISGPMVAGVFYLFLRAIRGEPAELGDIFSGFRRSFGHLFLGTLIQGLLIGACLAPFLIVFLLKFIPLVGQLQTHGAPPSADTLAAVKAVLFSSLPVLLFCAIPAAYLGVCWRFTLPLIIDREVDFWTAMKTSFRMVNRHWWQVFGLLVAIALLNLAGFFACCVGLVFTIPTGLAALMFAYETIFGPQKN